MNNSTITFHLIINYIRVKNLRRVQVKRTIHNEEVLISKKTYSLQYFERKKN